MNWCARWLNTKCFQPKRNGICTTSFSIRLSIGWKLKQWMKTTILIAYDTQDKFDVIIPVLLFFNWLVSLNAHARTIHTFFTSISPTTGKRTEENSIRFDFNFRCEMNMLCLINFLFVQWTHATSNIAFPWFPSPRTICVGLVQFVANFDLHVYVIFWLTVCRYNKDSIILFLLTQRLSCEDWEIFGSPQWTNIRKLNISIHIIDNVFDSMKTLNRTHTPCEHIMKSSIEHTTNALSMGAAMRRRCPTTWYEYKTMQFTGEGNDHIGQQNWNPFQDTNLSALSK